MSQDAPDSGDDPLMFHSNFPQPHLWVLNALYIYITQRRLWLISTFRSDNAASVILICRPIMEPISGRKLVSLVYVYKIDISNQSNSWETYKPSLVFVQQHFFLHKSNWAFPGPLKIVFVILIFLPDCLYLKNKKQVCYSWPIQHLQFTLPHSQNPLK